MLSQTKSYRSLTHVAQMAFVRWNLVPLLAAVFTFGLVLTINQHANAQDRRNVNVQDGRRVEDVLEPLLKGTERAPTITKIPAPFVEAIRREYEGSPGIQNETKFEPYLASRYSRVMDGIEIGKVGVFLPGPRPISRCANGTCDAPLSTSVWAGAWTGGTPTNITNPNLPVAAWTAGIVPNTSFSPTACGAHPTQAHHSIVPNGNDPVIPSIKTVAPIPASGNVASLRLGNQCPLYGGERIAKTFTVGPGETTLQFWYATVLQDPGHQASDQPGFGVYLLNPTPLPNRVDLDAATPGKQEFIIADRNNPFFGYNPALGVVYHDWSCVTVDLSGLEGQTVTLLLVNRDCGQGGHWGYSYVDSFCLGCGLNPTGDVSFNTAKSDCATGQICFDYTVPKTPAGTTGTVNLTLELYQNGTLVNTLASGVLTTNGTYCFTNVLSSLNTAVGGFDWRATANFTVPGATISPMVIGQKEEGNVQGKNNDCLIPPKPIDPCCPPWNKDMMKDMLFYQGSGSISAPYTLKYQPTTAFNNQMQAYLNYLHSVNSGITKITIDWELRHQGSGSSAQPPGTLIASAAVTWTWNMSGIGNPSISPPNFFTVSSPHMKVGDWYGVSTVIRVDKGQKFFPEKCANNDLAVRVQVIGAKSANRMSEPVLEFREGDKVLKSVPISEDRKQEPRPELSPGRANPIERRNN